MNLSDLKDVEMIANNLASVQTALANLPGESGLSPIQVRTSGREGFRSLSVDVERLRQFLRNEIIHLTQELKALGVEV